MDRRNELVAEFLEGPLLGCLVFPDFAKVDLRQGGQRESHAEGSMDSFEIGGLFEQTFQGAHSALELVRDTRSIRHDITGPSG
jgi:hypothetical protein